MKVSVIATFYNQEKYARKCIGSIVEQTYHDLQIILVDDVSNDRSGAICDEYAEIDGRIQVIHKENGGITSARNAGLVIADGDYVGFVDGDDYIEPNMYERMLAAVDFRDYDFVQCDMYHDKADSVYRGRSVGMEQLILDPKDHDEIWVALLDPGTENNLVTPNLCNKLIKRDLARRVCGRLPQSMKHGEDFVAVMDLIGSEAGSAFLLPMPLYHYVWRKESHCHAKDFSRISEIVVWYREAEKVLDQAGMLNQYRRFLQKSAVRDLLDVVRSLRLYAGDLPLYFFDNVHVLHGKRVILYGAGRIGHDYHLQLKREDGICLVAWVDSAFASLHESKCEVKSLEALDELSYDYVLVAVKSSTAAQEIIGHLLSRGIDRKKILWSTPKLMVEA